VGSERRPSTTAVAILLVSQFCSAAAELAQVTVLGKVIYDMTGSKLYLGLLGLAEFAPAALLVLLTGTVADRIDRRRVVACGLLAQAVATAGIGWYLGTTPTSVLPVFLGVLAFGTGRAFSGPAARALPADMAGPEHLPGLVARNAAAFQAALIAGPVLGGILLTINVRVPFVVLAGFLIIAAIAVLFIPIATPTAETAGLEPAGLEPAGLDLAGLRADALEEIVQEAGMDPASGHGLTARPEEGGGLREAMEGLRFVRSQPVLLGAISLDLFAVLFGGAVALLPAIAKDRLGVGAVGLGWLRAAGGIGAGIATLTLAARPITRRVGTTLLTVVAVFGIWTIVLGLTHAYALAFFAMVSLSAADAVSVYIRATLVPLLTPPDRRGRVLAVENVFIGASNELGAFESGVTGQVMGTAGSVVFGGAATLAVAAGWCALFPSLRRVDRFPNAAAGDSGSL
jgi:MFS family permease